MTRPTYKQNHEGVINYTGNKTQLITALNDILNKSKATRLVDAFCGGLSVTLHSQFENVLANDFSQRLIHIYKTLQETNIVDANNYIEEMIHKYNLGPNKEQKQQYLIYRDAVNRSFKDDFTSEHAALGFLILQYHSFSNIMRYNDSGEFNASFGQRTYNKSSQNKLWQFYDILNKKNIEFSNKSFLDLKIKGDDLVYIDPPYLITEAVYNNGWDDFTDGALMNWIDELDARGIDFVMSNVFHHRGASNHRLINWAKKYNVIQRGHKYVFNSYQAKNQEQETVEVMITNISLD